MADKEVKLKDGNDYLFPQAMMCGIDTNNFIAEATGTYIATEDCYCIGYVGSYTTIAIDNVKLFDSQYQSWVFAKKGQTVKCDILYSDGRYLTGTITVYGVKH